MCVCVGAVGKLRLRLQLVIGIGLGHGLGFDTCNVVAWRGVLKQTVASEASPVSQFAAAQHLTSLGICGARLRVKALPASWHLMSVA